MHCAERHHYMGDRATCQYTIENVCKTNSYGPYRESLTVPIYLCEQTVELLIFRDMKMRALLYIYYIVYPAAVVCV